MRNNLKNTLIGFVSLGVTGLLTSCPNPNGSYPESTNWLFVNQLEVEKLLKSPETITFDEKRYRLEIYFDKEQYRIGRRCPSLIFFSCDSSFLTQKRQFRFLLRDYVDNTSVLETNKLKVKELWVINKNKEFYFSTKKINTYGSNGNTEAPKNYTFTLNNDETLKDGGVAIMSFESKEKEYFIKTNKILKGQ